MEGDGGLAARIPARLSADKGEAFSAAEGRQFGLTVGGAFLAIAAFFWWRDHPTRAAVVGALGGALALAGLAIPARLGPLYRGWMRFAHAISRVTTPIFLGIVYFLVIMPFGLVRRALGKNALIRPATDRGYWVSRNPIPGPRSDLQRQF